MFTKSKKKLNWIVLEFNLNRVSKNLHKVKKTIIIFWNIFFSQNNQNFHKVASNIHLIESNKQNLYKIGCNQPNKINPQQSTGNKQMEKMLFVI